MSNKPTLTTEDGQPVIEIGDKRVKLHVVGNDADGGMVETNSPACTTRILGADGFERFEVCNEGSIADGIEVSVEVESDE